MKCKICMNEITDESKIICEKCGANVSLTKYKCIFPYNESDKSFILNNRNLYINELDETESERKHREFQEYCRRRRTEIIANRSGQVNSDNNLIKGFEAKDNNEFKLTQSTIKTLQLCANLLSVATQQINQLYNQIKEYRETNKGFLHFGNIIAEVSMCNTYLQQINRWFSQIGFKPKEDIALILRRTDEIAETIQAHCAHTGYMSNYDLQKKLEEILIDLQRNLSDVLDKLNGKI